MTKPLAGQSFAGFLEDLGLRSSEAKVNKVALGGQSHELPDQQGALRALVVGGLLIKAAEAQAEPHSHIPALKRHLHPWTPFGRVASF